jgi:phosphopantetheinyl transferase
MESFSPSEWIDYEVGRLELSQEGFHLWQIRPSHLFIQYLNAKELLRYGGMMNEEVKLSYCSAQGGLRKIASFYMSCRPEEVNMHRGRRGKPYVPGAPEFNLTHTGGLILAAFASSPVGIDIESTERMVRGEAIARRHFSREEVKELEASEGALKILTFLRYWVCKEAIVKLSGDGIYHGLRDARVDLASGNRSRGTYKGRNVWLNEFRPLHNLVAALASWRPLNANGFFRI